MEPRIKPSESIGAWAGKLHKMLAIYMAQIFKEHQIDLTRLQWVLMHKIKQQEGGMSQNDLAILTERNKASLTRLINTLEKKELVLRIPSKVDGRSNEIHLTAKGNKVLESSYPIMKDMIATLHVGLDEAEMKRTVATMKKVINNIEIHSDIKLSH